MTNKEYVKANIAKVGGWWGLMGNGKPVKDGEKVTWSQPRMIPAILIDNGYPGLFNLSIKKAIDKGCREIWYHNPQGATPFLQPDGSWSGGMDFDQLPKAEEDRTVPITIHRDSYAALLSQVKNYRPNGKAVVINQTTYVGNPVWSDVMAKLRDIKTTNSINEWHRRATIVEKCLGARQHIAIDALSIVRNGISPDLTQLFGKQFDSTFDYNYLTLLQLKARSKGAMLIGELAQNCWATKEWANVPGLCNYRNLNNLGACPTGKVGYCYDDTDSGWTGEIVDVTYEILSKGYKALVDYTMLITALES